MTQVHESEPCSDQRALVVLCTRLEGILNSRAEVVVVGELQHLCSDNIAGLRIVRSETGFKVYPEGQSPDLERIQQAVHKMECRLRKERSATEKIYMRVENHLRTQAAAASLHTGMGRVVSGLMFRFIHGYNKRCGEQRYSGRRRIVIACLLSEPERIVDNLLLRNAFMNAQFYSRRMAHLANSVESARLVREFVWPDESDYQRVINGDNGSRILLTIHMGDFTGAFKRISSHAAEHRTATSLRREGLDEGWSNLFAGGSSRHFVACHGRDSPLQIVSNLRRGGHTVAILADLKDEFGQTTNVQFLGRTARFVKGPAQLAVSGRAFIYPFVTFQSGQKQRIEFSERISPELLPGENMTDAVNRITQQLVRQAEQWIKRAPDQWKFLGTLPGYFVMEDNNEQQPVQA
ncbi:hypothetical protein [Pseudohongiella spirulinae]|uniref:Uncharacterized protein n=1 Tax=Pseudohongiella spirulinae TaxID=1249552 RepID=A0A0S2KFG3_9GAMM|nr:hypothetical protein [Pseudohongiella spirulinae]ALO46846.1 hypothetical protein PS2015_2211 [Pseudohongiella spirulinae]